MVLLKKFYEWSFSLMFAIKTLIYFQVSIKFLSYNPKVYIYTKAILLNGLCELSFPVYQMISLYHFPDKMFPKEWNKIFYNGFSLKKKIFFADLRIFKVTLISHKVSTSI